MDLITQYRQLSNSLDQCDSVDQIKAYQSRQTFHVLRNEFWKQRSTFLSSADPLIRQKAQAKLQWIQHHFGCSIPLRRTISPFLAPNGLSGIFISPEVIIGENCVIFQQVTIAGNTFADDPSAGFPSIGSNVHIGPGAKIIGNVTVGNNVRIGPNCCITENIPSNSIVTAGAPCVIQKDVPPDNTHLSAEQFFETRFQGDSYDYLLNSEHRELDICAAAPSDIDQIINLYKERITWFKAKKIPQWSRYLDHHPREEFLCAIQRGEYYVVKESGQLIAGFAISTNSENWMDSQSNAFYLSRVVSKPNCKNLVSHIVAYAKEHTRAAGKDYLRLECVYKNTALNQVWENYGFALIRDVEGTYHCSLRQWQTKTTQT